MEVQIIQRNYVTKVYCKTDDFPFHIISLPFLESNISNKLCYLVFYGQVLRYQRLCSHLRETFFFEVYFNNLFFCFLIFFFSLVK
jgi:hypothetical protein